MKPISFSVVPSVTLLWLLSILLFVKECVNQPHCISCRQSHQYISSTVAIVCYEDSHRRLFYLLVTDLFANFFLLNLECLLNCLHDIHEEAVYGFIIVGGCWCMALYYVYQYRLFSLITRAKNLLLMLKTPLHFVLFISVSKFPPVFFLLFGSSVAQNMPASELHQAFSGPSNFT